MEPQHYIPKPCHENWNKMTGDDQKKFCDQCACHVHNLTGMSHKQILSLREDLGGKLCGSFQLQQAPPEQTRMRPPRRIHLAKPLMIGVTISSLALAACNSESHDAVVGKIASPEHTSNQSPEDPAVLKGDVCLPEPLPKIKPNVNPGPVPVKPDESKHAPIPDPPRLLGIVCEPK